MFSPTDTPMDAMLCRFCHRALRVKPGQLAAADYCVKKQAYAASQGGDVCLAQFWMIAGGPGARNPACVNSEGAR